MSDMGENPAQTVGASLAALGLRAADPSAIERIRAALVASGLINPYPPGHLPSEAFGAYSTFLVIPESFAVTRRTDISEEILGLANLAHSLGATQVTVWSEEVDEVIPLRRSASVESPPGYHGGPPLTSH